MRRNRIKAVINVPRGGRPSASTADRPLTPIVSNSLSSPSTPQSHDPSSGSVSQQSFSPSRSAIRSSSPLLACNPAPTSPVKKHYPEYTLGLVRSPISSPTKEYHHHGVIDRPTTPNFDPHSSYQFPISPGGIQRPSPSASPMRYIPQPIPSPQRPSPVPSPVNNSSNKQLAIFNSNSNSADSHEVARYMSLPSPSGIFSARTPDASESHHQHNRSQNSTPSSREGAFSSISNSMRDPANSIVNNSELLRQRLAKPSPSLTISKYQTLRKEFLSKGNQNIASTSSVSPEERKQLTILHFAFWNPPKKSKEKSSARSNRSSSACNDSGVGSNFSASIKHEKQLDTDNTKLGIAARRVTVGDMPISLSTPDKSYSEPISITQEKETPVNIGPRVKVGPDGQLILDEQSLIVETSESQRAKKQLSEMETVSGANFAVGSSGLFRNKKNARRGHDWSDRETIKFYKALSMCGTDFSMMTTLFPTRTRAELKAKFKREDRKNSGQISSALSCQEFDPGEGITDSEEEQTQEDLIIGGEDGKPKKKRRRPRNKPLTEIERRLREEMEEEHAILNSDLGSLPPKSPKNTPHFKNLTYQGHRMENDVENKAKKERGAVKGRPTVSWKSNVIIDDETGKRMSKMDIRKVIEEESCDDSCLPPKKRKRNQNPRIKKKDCIKSGKLSPSKDKEQTTLPSAHPDDPSIRSVDCIDILRFDGSDPLGLKLPTTTVETAAIPTSSVTGSEISEPDRGEGEESDEEEEIPRPTSLIDPVVTVMVPPPKKLSPTTILPPNVKVLPFRVPGPGPLGPKSPAIVDEIDIEISCQ